MLARQMNRSGKTHALLSTARVANVPSVVSNVWVGVVIGLMFTDIHQPFLVKALALALAGVLLYVGGNFFNDWMDRAWDRSHRPERALPRGLFPTGLYAGLAAGLLAAGTALACWTSLRSGMAAGGIVFWIVVYTIWHKKTSWAVIPMGLCRALLPVMGCLAFYPYIDHVWPVACALLVYIAGLSLSARHESMAEPPAWVGITSRVLLLSAALLVAWGNTGLYLPRLLAISAAVPYLAWTSFSLRYRRKPVPVLVSSLLAGIPLVDWMVLLPVSVLLFRNPDGASQALATACLLAPPVAFAMAKLLQRVAPAT